MRANTKFNILDNAIEIYMIMVILQQYSCLLFHIEIEEKSQKQSRWYTAIILNRNTIYMTKAFSYTYEINTTDGRLMLS